MSVTQRQPADSRDRLSATIHYLGDILGTVIREQAGDTAFALEEQVRALAKELRANDQGEQADAMRALVTNLTISQARDLIKSFSEYFALVNLSEQLQRTWVLRERALRHPREPRSESIGAAVDRAEQRRDARS